MGLLTVLLATCKIDKLTKDPPPLAALSVAPGRVLDSAAVGSTAMHVDSIALTSSGAGALAWSASVKVGGGWLDVTPKTGTTPARVRGGRRHGERHRRRPERQHRVSLASACRRPRGWHERLGLVRWQRGDGPGLPRCARRHPARLHGAARHHDCRGSDRTGSAGGGAGSSGEYGDELHRRRRDDVRNQYARRSPVRH